MSQATAWFIWKLFLLDDVFSSALPTSSLAHKELCAKDLVEAGGTISVGTIAWALQPQMEAVMVQIVE